MNESPETIENVVVIGSGPAGWTAAIYTARATLKPLVVEGALTAENQNAGTLPMGQLTTTTQIDNFPGFPIGALGGYLNSSLDEERACALPPEAFGENVGIYGAALVELMRKQALNFGSRTLDEDVNDVDLNIRPFKLSISDGSVIRAKTIIVATGASVRWLGLPSEERFKNNGVSACAVCDGAAPRFAEKNIVVVGGGDTALEDALYLTKFAKKVYVVHRRAQLRASKAMERAAKANDKIEFVWERKPLEILGNDELGVTGIALESTKNPKDHDLVLDASGVFVAIGRRPNVEFLHGALDLTDAGTIKRTIPFRTNTSVDGVFAAGDVADEFYRQAIVAAASGACAAMDAERFLNNYSEC